MSKDKKKRDKEDELYLASLKGRVRVQEILRRLRASSVEADLATEALDDMISEVAKQTLERIDTRMDAQDTRYRVLLVMMGAILALIGAAQIW